MKERPLSGKAAICLPSDYLSHLRVLCFHLERVALDGYDVIYRANLQRDIDADC